jgi:HEPN domain-containing protein
LPINQQAMIDTEKQIIYWTSSASNDLTSAKILVDRNRFLHGLFFCHLVIEKAIKAHVVKKTNNIAPRSHNLIYLAEKADLQFDEKDELFLGVLMKYQLQGRYPDYNPIIPPKKKVNEYLTTTEELFKWLKVKL